MNRLDAPFRILRLLALASAAVTALAIVHAAEDSEEARAAVQFVEEPSAGCVEKKGVQVLVKSRDPKRTVRVWLDRIHMGVGTGDRSRTDLAPGAEPVALGCSHTTDGPQEWRIVRAVFVAP